jgi:hypothetical protein
MRADDCAIWEATRRLGLLSLTDAELVALIHDADSQQPVVWRPRRRTTSGSSGWVLPMATAFELIGFAPRSARGGRDATPDLAHVIMFTVVGSRECTRHGFSNLALKTKIGSHFS